MATEQLFLPESPAAALDLLEQHGPALFVMAGGTVGMNLINEGLLAPRLVMSLHRAQLSGVRAANNHWEIGAATPLARVAQLEALPLLAEAARQIGGWAIRNMATLGGNLFVPPPAGDAAVALLALDAEVIASSRRGDRSVPLSEFYRGHLRTTLEPGELVTAIHVPRPAGQTAFLKYGRRKQNTPAVVTVAVRLVRDDQGRCAQARVALGAVGDHPFRAVQAEASLVGRRLDEAALAQASALAAEEARPAGDALASAWYRRQMTRVYVQRALQSLGA